MSLADEVLAEHTKASLGDYCSVCHDQWPCEPVRLALSLHAAEQVVEAARRVYRKGDNLTRALAEYDKGGRG